jgi:hypothetical protein
MTMIPVKRIGRFMTYRVKTLVEYKQEEMREAVRAIYDEQAKQLWARNELFTHEKRRRAASRAELWRQLDNIREMASPGALGKRVVMDAARVVADRCEGDLADLCCEGWYFNQGKCDPLCDGEQKRASFRRTREREGI